MIAGVEVMCRVGPRRARPLPRAPLPSDRLTGSFAAAAAAGKLHGLAEDQLVHAFGICGSQAGGIIEYLADGSWTKRLHPGLGRPRRASPRRSLARAGFTGPETRVRGRARLLRGLRGRPRRRAGSTRCSPRSAATGSSRSSPSSPTRAARSRSRTWTARCGSASGTASGPRTSSRPLPHRRGSGAAALGAARGQAPPAERLRGEVQPAVSARRDPVRGRAGLAEFTDDGVRDEAVLRRGRRVTYELDPTIDYPRQFVGRRASQAAPTAACSRSARTGRAADPTSR